MPDPRTDRTTLTSTQYGNGANLVARASIYRWQRPPFDLVSWVLDQHEWQGNEGVLDVGCGYGAYLHGLRRRAETVVGVDLSAGMLREVATRGAPLVCGDGQQLPLRDATFDVAIAPHMLYHLPDVRLGIAELRRVVRAGGVVLAVTNAVDDKPEIRRLLHRAADRPLGSYAKVDNRFTLEDAPSLLGEAFDHLRVVDVCTEIAVPEVEPVIRYVDSIRSAAEPALRVDWQQLLSRAASMAQSEIDAVGAFRITTHAGVVVAQ